MTYAVFDMFNVAQRKFTSRSNSGIFWPSRQNANSNTISLANELNFRIW